MQKRKKSFYIVIIALCIALAVSAFMFGKELWQRQKEQAEFEKLAEFVTEGAPEHKRDITSLQSQNPDCIGWVHIPDSTIDYPVMHTPEQPEKYLHLNFEGQYSYSGVPFLDYGCSPESGNLIIYGHNMKNGTMFSDLRKYLDEEFRSSHLTIEFETAEGCSYYTVTDVKNVHKTDDWYANLNPEDGKEYLTLSTCYGATKSDRLIVIAEKN